MEPENITIAMLRNAIPAFAESELERLYQHLYSSLAHFTIYDYIDAGISTYVAWKSGEVIALLLFRSDGKHVHVLNEQFRIGAEEIARFARHIFDTCRSISLISFHAIDTNPQRLPFPYQKFHCTEDIVLTLPRSVDEYRAALGKATRSYINRYLKKLSRDFPGLRHEVFLKGEAAERHVRAIIDLNRARMAEKRKLSSIDEGEAARIASMVRRCGLVSVMTVNGKVCAGTINYQIGDNYFLQVIGHDPAFNEYRIGTLCCYLTICACMDRGGREYHFLWGQYDYKYRLLGIQRDLDHLVIYRSRMHMVQNGGVVLRTAIDGYALQAKNWLLRKARQPDGAGLMSRLAFHCVNGLRDTKRLAWRLLARKAGAAASAPARQEH